MCLITAHRLLYDQLWAAPKEFAREAGAADASLYYASLIGPLSTVRGSCARHGLAACKTLGLKSQPSYRFGRLSGPCAAACKI